jgi:ParB family transcriptional regulator, chromosome partitioning protein
MSKPADAQRKALGKGLSALLPQRSAPATTKAIPAKEVPSPSDSSQVIADARTLPIDFIEPNPDQPRHDFDEARIQELAKSILMNGVIQPITVCRKGANRFQIVAGERRWRAAKSAGFLEIPVYIREVQPDRLLELALIENIQREDLNPIETAKAYEQLIEQHHFTHEQVAERTGKDRSSVTNFLRLLRLTESVREQLIGGKISMGHARALLGLSDPNLQMEVCERVVARDLSVRETEQMVKRLNEPSHTTLKPENEQPKVDANTRAALESMAMSLGTKVRIAPRSDKSGRLEIEYYSLEDLQRIYEVIVADRE